MPIYADPTELRANSRLPAKVQQQCIELPGLEAVTGADLLVATGKAPPDVRPLIDVDTFTLHNGKSPTVIAERLGLALPDALAALQFCETCESGLLIQRKTGRDLPSSIPDLSRILERMLRWTRRPWLLFVGDLKCSRDGKVVVDGEVLNWSYNSLQGALESWQLPCANCRGGHVTFLSRDSLIAPWLARWLDKLRALPDEKILGPGPIYQPIIGPEAGRKPWRSTLMSFPSLGLKTANAISDGHSTLAACLERMTQREWLDDKCEARPRGIGTVRVREWRSWLGLEDDCLELVLAAVPEGYRAQITLEEI